MYPQYFNPYVYGQPQGQATNGQIPLQTQNNTQAQSQMISGGLISVPNEAEAFNYPVAHGNSVTFRNDNEPYVYIKSVGFSPLDRPIFEKYKKEEAEVVDNKPAANENPIFDELRAEIATLKTELDTLKTKLKTIPKTTTKKVLKEVIEDDDEE